MTKIDRREFVKSVSVALGTAAVSGLSPIISMAQEKPGAAKASSTGTIYELYALKYFAPLNYKLAKALYQVGWAEDLKINCYIWAIRDKNNGEIRSALATTPFFIFNQPESEFLSNAIR